MKILFAFILVFLIENGNTKEWTRVNIPGAKCGDGKDYSIFIQEGNPQKMFIEFMGGGVCWDHYSCFERVSVFPWLHSYPEIQSYSVFTSQTSALNPFKEFTKIYFPYCTGDVHLGSHIGQYNDKEVFHYGSINVSMAIRYLQEKKLINFSTYNELAFYGMSAGAIASLVYAKRISHLFPAVKKKTIIADSPGLHFGETFWEKFDEEMKEDFDKEFRQVDLHIDFSNGLVARHLGPVFELYHDWNIGFIYALRDYVMSKIFGNISPKEAKELILGPEGVVELAKNYPNVDVWYKDIYMHTFFLSKYSATLKNHSGESAIDFVNKTLKATTVGEEKKAESSVLTPN